jgi:hypothetical protein
MGFAEPIICPLWVSSDKHFRARHYRAWDRPCHLCGRKVVVSDALKRELESGDNAVLVCEQCALVSSEELHALPPPEPATESEEACPVCVSLQAQEEAAAMQLAQSAGLPESAGLQQKWEHLSRARWTHKTKAHAQDARGK